MYLPGGLWQSCTSCRAGRGRRWSRDSDQRTAAFSDHRFRTSPCFWPPGGETLLGLFRTAATSWTAASGAACPSAHLGLEFLRNLGRPLRGRKTRRGVPCRRSSTVSGRECRRRGGRGGGLWHQIRCGIDIKAGGPILDEGVKWIYHSRPNQAGEDRAKGLHGELHLLNPGRLIGLPCAARFDAIEEVAGEGDDVSLHHMLPPRGGTKRAKHRHDILRLKQPEIGRAHV